MPMQICQYDDCMEHVGEMGVVVSLRKPTWDDEKRAIFCCAAHAAASLTKLARDRNEKVPTIPNQWKVV